MWDCVKQVSKCEKTHSCFCLVPGPTNMYRYSGQGQGTRQFQEDSGMSKQLLKQTWRPGIACVDFTFILRKIRGRVGNKVPQKHHNWIKTFLLSKWPFSMPRKRGGGAIISGKVWFPWCIHSYTVKSGTFLWPAEGTLTSTAPLLQRTLWLGHEVSFEPRFHCMYD